MTPADVRSARERLNMTQSEFARALRVVEPTVRAWENARRPVSGPAIVAIGFLLRGSQTAEAEHDALKQENERLKAMVDDADAALMGTAARAEALEAERDSLQARTKQLYGLLFLAREMLRIKGVEDDKIDAALATKETDNG